MLLKPDVIKGDCLGLHLGRVDEVYDLVDQEKPVNVQYPVGADARVARNFSARGYQANAAQVKVSKLVSKNVQIRNVGIKLHGSAGVSSILLIAFYASHSATSP